MKYVLWLSLCLTVLTSCVTTSVTRLSSSNYPRLHPDQVVIYLNEEDIPGKYEKIAIIYAEGDYELTDEAQMYDKVRKEAAKLGANGVLQRGIKDPSTGAKVANAFLGTGANRKSEMIAIYVYSQRNYR